MGSGGDNSEPRCGFAVLAGLPNVGKSTLLNRILGSKLAIVTSKPQTTRTRILGIRTREATQTLWVDTPGLHAGRGATSLLSSRMVERAREEIQSADVVAVVIDAAAGVRAKDDRVLELVEAGGKPRVIVATKIDLVPPGRLLEVVARLGERVPGVDVIPVSGTTGENVDSLERVVGALLPAGPFLYPEGEITDQSARRVVAELVREKVFEETREEIPYRTAVSIDSFVEHPDRNLSIVEATILVERTTHRKILIGRGGAQIREIGRRARLELEGILGQRLHLSLFVKVKPDWTKNARVLDELGL